MMFNNYKQDDVTQEILEEIQKLKGAVSEKSRPFLTLDEASKYLKLSKNTLYGYTSKSLIPHFKIQNRKIYFKIDDLNNFILNQKNKIRSMQELAEEVDKKMIQKK